MTIRRGSPGVTRDQHPFFRCLECPNDKVPEEKTATCFVTSPKVLVCDYFDANSAKPGNPNFNCTFPKKARRL